MAIVSSPALSVWSALNDFAIFPFLLSKNYIPHLLTTHKSKILPSYYFAWALFQNGPMTTKTSRGFFLFLTFN